MIKHNMIFSGQEMDTITVPKLSSIKRLVPDHIRGVRAVLYEDGWAAIFALGTEEHLLVALSKAPRKWKDLGRLANWSRQEYGLDLVVATGENNRLDEKSVMAA